MKMKTMKYHHELYLKCDDFLLTNCVKDLEKISSRIISRVCHSHYLSPPALSWDAMLDVAKVKLELIPDPDIFTFFEKEMRSAAYYILSKFSKNSNKHLKSFDPKEKSKHIIHLDATNL